jgi:hypothetical protein
MPPGLSLDGLKPANYSAEGRRLFPFLVFTQALWLVAVIAVVVLRARAA